MSRPLPIRSLLGQPDAPTKARGRTLWGNSYSALFFVYCERLTCLRGLPCWVTDFAEGLLKRFDLLEQNQCKNSRSFGWQDDPYPRNGLRSVLHNFGEPQANLHLGNRECTTISVGEGLRKRYVDLPLL